MWVYLNDRFVDRKQAVVSVFDHGFLYGDGIYETLRAYEGRIFQLAQHLTRLRRSADLIGLALPMSEQAWPPLLEEVIRRNALHDAYVRITVSRGEGEPGLDPALCSRPTVIIMAQPLPRYPPAYYEEGVRVILSTVRRNPPAALDPQIKSLNFLNNILAKREAARAGAFDAVMLNLDGFLAECTASNLFFVHEGHLQTPALSCGILDGVTRGLVLRLAREHGLRVDEGTYEPSVLRSAEECFLTNTTMEVMPVQRVDGIPVGSGRPGPLTRQLQALFKDAVVRLLG